jgi:U3 small nucleolar RNA-associated protein 13
VPINSLTVEKVIGDQEDSEDVIYTFHIISDDHVVSAHQSGLLKLWNYENCELKKSWKFIHTGPIICLDYSTTHNLLASGGSDSFIRIWDFQNHVNIGSLKGCSGIVSVVKFHPTKQIVFGVGDDAAILSWNLETKAIEKKFEGHMSRVTSLEFSECGKYMVSGSRDKVMILWDIEKVTQIRTIPAYECIESVLILPYNIQIPNGLELSDKSKIYAASAGEEGVVKIWQLNESKMLYQQTSSLISKASEDDGLAITQMLYNPKSQQIALISYDHNIIVHDLSTFECYKQLIGFNQEILDLTLMGKKDQYLIMATNSNDIKVYDTQTMNSIILKGHDDIVLALSSYKNLLLSSGKDHSVRIWEADFENFTFKCVAMGTKHTNAVGSVDFCKTTGDFFVSVSQDQCLKLWSIPRSFNENELTTLVCINTQLAHDKDINCVAVSPNDRYVATSSQDKTIKLWEREQLKLLGVFRGHRRGVWSVRFSPVDQVIASSAADCTIRLWNINDMTCLKTLEGHEGSVLRLEFVTNGMQILSSDSNGLLKLWTIKSSECIKTMDKHEDRIWALTLSKDEMTVYTGGTDSKLIQWHDVTEEKRKVELEKKQDELLQEQELNNLLKQKKTLKALRLALNLNRPHMTLKIITSIIKEQEDGLEETIHKLSETHKQSLIQHAVNWNTNSKTCRIAQVVFQVIMSEILTDDLKLPGIEKLIEESLPYSDRHYKRMTEYLKDLKFVEYTFQCMQPYEDILQ